MFKKIVAAITITIFVFFAGGCEDIHINEKELQESNIENNQSNILISEELGLSFIQPESWINNEYIEINVNGPFIDTFPLYGSIKVLFIPKEIMDKMREMEKGKNNTQLYELQFDEEYMNLVKSHKQFIHFNIYKKDILGEKSIKSLSNFENNVLLGEKDNLIYYLSYPSKDHIKNLSEESKRMYEGLYEEINSIINSIKILNINAKV
ncbi:MAG: hypothetical protein N4A57_14340 [Anaeromicrobium sp.]|uniref:hypothetical protein n=1 Tax=Anaeromicrobium sp. TaxID=1929132 RepID=UPI0025DC4D3F|nr:hypothetical protein [Anaeromicrobium sp.]MCT4595427.1 hypothetical protein [Anaeromicrobium sp.]